MTRSSRSLRRAALCGLAFAGAIAAASAGPAEESPPAISGRCSVQFFGTSSLHDFDGEAPCARLEISAPDAAGRYGARAEVEIAQMKTGISARDRKMREMFDAKKFPRITATFAELDPRSIRARAPAALPFRVALHGVEKSVTPRLSRYSETAGQRARFRAEFDLTLQDFGLEPPVAMGFIRVGDRVHVVVDVELEANAAPRAATISSD
ncbi:MAG TPA: YceI family protein [Myxococcota bacterium]|nr:YceI family protein [Myxococcota bacterium]